MALDESDPAGASDATLEPDVSLDDFVEEFPTGDRPTPAPVARVATEALSTPSTETPEAVIPRDRDDAGKFVKTRQRAKSQQASREDVPRIADLTKRLREAEAERDALKARPAEQPRAPVAAPEPTKTAPAVERSAKPKIDDFDDYGVYLEAVTDWKIADARATDRDTQQREAETTRLATSWRDRVEAAKAEYPDFEAVALLAPTSIPQGSLVDAWILEHKAGAKVLYHLQKHPDALQSLLTMPLFDQVDGLSLLAQRLTGPAPSSVATGVPATPHSRVPRPPTPVRTGPVRATEEPPGDEADLDAFGQFYGSPQPRA